MGQKVSVFSDSEENAEVEKMLSELLESIERLDKAALALAEVCE